jgi:prepilin-type N-terminal cleavage/methylation domain-containing protein
MKNFGFWIADFGLSAHRRDRRAGRSVPQIQNPKSKIQNGFTLAELLIVIALIVLLVAMAVPAFNFITGSRSVDGAQNQIAAFLGRARAEAIGVQETCGVFFFLDPQTDRVNMTLVHPVTPPATFVGPANEVECWLDLGTIVTTEPEFLALPSGVGVQFVNDTLFNPPTSNVRAADGYIGFNKANVGNNNASPANDTVVLYGGVILFDGAGRLVSKRYAFKSYDIPDPTSANKEATKMGLLLYKNDATKAMNVKDVAPLMSTSAGIHPPRSQFGFVLFDNEAFRNAFPPASPGNRAEYDWAIFNSGGSYNGGTSKEDVEETWLDNNSTPLLVNRYNGTLVRGE